jgi:hypothetical protein
MTTSRVYEDGREIRIVVRLPVEEQQAGLRGDGDAHLVRHLEPAASLEGLLCQEHLHVPL